MKSVFYFLKHKRLNEDDNQRQIETYSCIPANKSWFVVFFGQSVGVRPTKSCNLVTVAAFSKLKTESKVGTCRNITGRLDTQGILILCTGCIHAR